MIYGSFTLCKRGADSQKHYILELTLNNHYFKRTYSLTTHLKKTKKKLKQENQKLTKRSSTKFVERRSMNL